MRILAVTVLGALAACSPEPPAKVVEDANALQPGEYVATTKVSALRSTDASEPGTKLKIGDMRVARGCVGADGTPEVTLFAEDGDQCTTSNSYVSGGKMSIQLSCTRKGMPGQILPAVDGHFAADSFQGTVTTTTYLVASGDYSLTRSITAKRVGECPAVKG